MKSLVAASASGVCFALAIFSATSGSRQLGAARVPSAVPVESLTAVVRGFCSECHNPTVKDGNLSLEEFDVAHADSSPDVAERIITKLRAGMMPPPHTKGTPRGDTLVQLASAIERVLDQHAVGSPEPGTRTFQRLNRAEYERSIKDLLGLEVEAGSWLPLDTKSANFDNIADVQTPSATTLDGYLDAASEISLLAVGDPHASARTTAYKVPRLASQWEHVYGAPVGTRGGVSVIHTFPADGEYIIAVSLHAIPTGQLYGSSSPFDEKVEVSVNGERVALLDVPRGMSQADPNGMELRTPRVLIRAGPQRVTAAFVKTFEGPVNDNLTPIGASIADTDIGHQFGVTNLPHVQVMFVRGPYNPTGVSETPTRKRIFTCRPTSLDEARPCATKIVTALGSEAYRRPLSPNDLKSLMAFYDRGATMHGGGFETGIRHALEAILASPHFIFRFEELPAAAKPGQRYTLTESDLASRLSFFLWGAPPDETLISLARDHSLSKPEVLEAQAKRMLADPRSEALATRFAAQWLRLQDIDKVHPDALQFPNFRQQIADDMQRETELFFDSIVRENRNVLELFSADYTFINEALAKHYGIPGVKGPEFRRVTYPDERRRGLLGQASILMLTSQANRTSPVLRGKWVMEVLLGSPPPPPPPNVPDLEKTGDAKDGRLLTTRERMEQHRANPQCQSCHQYMDPIGLALDNFDVMGQWRTREFGSPVDTRGMLYDGTPISNLAELERALMKRPTPLIRTFTQNLLVYALGRRAESYDGPTIRKIAADAEANGNRAQDFILGVIKSDAFRMKSVSAESVGNGK
jgi:Protein of unknown function (DUF1592)/Protein of unknown function (DUF1588)/Protein of unknown function (DUF1595)/Protein of unknown function (DUF1585)/Protein of unknown function (DUF1587)